ncbi:MAG: cytochrome c [Albidovulum sp.]|nr:cytochrome c [Albidovulum sp.]
MNRSQKIVSFAALPVAALAVAVAWAYRHPEIAPVELPGVASFDSDLLYLGEALAGIGACEVCHTSRGGAPYAGGLALPTPFGVVYSTNITPDAETGIGGWSEAAFRRAMRQGVDRKGRHLYPAFPYDHFTKATDEDIRAIYAYLITREPVDNTAPENELRFPFNIRALLAGWKLLFLETGEYQPDPGQNEEWNRGAYLAEGLGHCGACHSPRNIFGAVLRDSAYDGGEAEHWLAPALNEKSPAPIPWSQIQLVNYLFDGWDSDHGIAGGPMAPIVNHLYDQSEDDIFAIAAYFESRQRRPPNEAERQLVIDRAKSLDWVSEPGYLPDKTPEDPSVQNGMEVFRDQCSNCHKRGGEQLPVSLALTSTVNASDPRNVIHIIFDGIRPTRGAMQRSMPGMGASILDRDIVDLVKFLRWHFTDLLPWDGVAEHVAEKRASW